MTDSTYNYLKQKAKGSLERFPKAKLVFDVDNKSELSDKGLTRRIWLGEDWSLVSINVGEQGADICKDWWNKAVGVSARGRYFAAAKIFNNEKNKTYGVITINGNKPAYFVSRELEAEWEVLPLLEVLSEELGRQLARIYEHFKGNI